MAWCKITGCRLHPPVHVRRVLPKSGRPGIGRGDHELAVVLHYPPTLIEKGDGEPWLNMLNEMGAENPLGACVGQWPGEHFQVMHNIDALNGPDIHADTAAGLVVATADI